MTLGQLLEFLSSNTYATVFFFFALPLLAFIANYMAKGEGHLSPWCIFYSILIYCATIPGIFSLLLNLYHLFFEKKSLYDISIITQVLPFLSMMLTLGLIKKNVNFSDIPGFGKITGFVSIITILMLAFFLLEKTRLLVFSYLPFHWILIILLVIFAAIHFGLKAIVK